MESAGRVRWSTVAVFGDAHPRNRVTDRGEDNCKDDVICWDNQHGSDDPARNGDGYADLVDVHRIVSLVGVPG